MKLRRASLVLLALPFLAFGCRNTDTNDNSNTTTPVDTNVVIQNTAPPVTNTTVTNTQPLQQTREQELQQIARSFAERYGSFSNSTNYANLESLLVFMTATFRADAEQFIAEERIKTRDSSVYYGMTTRTVRVETRIFDEQGGEASFLVATYRTEAIGTTNNTESYQEDILIDMRRESGTWKVHRATWQTP